MASPEERDIANEQTQYTRSVRLPSIDLTRHWYQHPFIVFVVPLITLLCVPKVYDLVVSGRSLPYDVNRLNEVASLMDDIYTTLANMTFIPQTSIKRGPHQINTTAITCKRDPAVLYLMEVLPYVDPLEVHEPDWLFGGEFMDYRGTNKLDEGCDPLHARVYWDYMTPSTIALTSWGSGGWNGDRTWVLMYDTAKHAMRVYEGEEWITRSQKPESNGDGYTSVGIFAKGIEAGRSVLDQIDNQWGEWFDASVLLSRMKEAYQSAAWSPWETSNRETGWGVDRDIVTRLIRKNGWLETFNPDQFNVDLIRAQHKPSGRGWADDALKAIQDLQGLAVENGGQIDPGRLSRRKRLLADLESQLKTATNGEDRWLFTWRMQKAKWDLEQDEADLMEAQKEKLRLCPHDVCMHKEDDILWEFRALEKDFTKIQNGPSTQTACEKREDRIREWALTDPNRIQDCVVQLDRQKHWLFLAYSLSKADALAHCARSNRSLLPPDSLESRAKAKIAWLKRDIERDEVRMWQMVEWEKELPEHATKARTEFAMWDSAIANGRWNVREEIAWIEDQLVDGGDKQKLWRSLDGWDDLY